MAFKLLIEVTEEGALDVSHDGQIEPIVLLGALRTLEHNVLTTMDAMAAQGLMESLGGEENAGDPAPGGE